MKYNCLRTNQYVKMFVVGLLLYFGETVFFKCSEEKTFTVQVNTLTGLFIEVSGCKGTDMLSDFMLKFEDACNKKILDMNISKIEYKLIYKKKLIVKNRKPIKDKSLTDLGIGKNSQLYLITWKMASERDEELDNLKLVDTYKHKFFPNIDEQPIKKERRKSIDMKKFKSYTSFQKEGLINQLDKKKSNSYGHEKKDPSTSTCLLRRCCKICGC